jgi:NAD+ kinase
VSTPAVPQLKVVPGREEPPRRIGMVLHPERDATPVLETVRRLARRNGTTVLASADPPARDQLAGDSELLLAVGEDGTVLEAMRLAAPHGIPVLGVNLGRLGDLSELEIRRLSRALDAVARGDFSVESQTALTVHLGRGGPLMAFKGVVVSRGRGRSEARLALHVDGELISRQAGDGLIVSSPGGSTAPGGPIVSPRLEAIVVTPLAPHGALSRSLVLSLDEPITLKVLRDSSPLALEIDGQENIELPPESRLIVEATPNAGRVVRLGSGHAARLRPH